MPRFYSFLKILFGLALKAYFKKIEIVGIENVPKDQPVLFTPNHQNAFLDAFLMGAFSPVSLHFLTRSDVFTWWSRPILRSVNMMPVYRIRDGYSKLDQNKTIFKTCEKLFSQKKSVLMFAEGNHGEHHYIRPLTKGAARLALQSQVEIDEELKIVPVGLNYFEHRHPSTRVIIVFGEPIPVSRFVGQYQKSSGVGLIAMRDKISKGMKSTLIIPDKTEDYEDRKRFVFQKGNEHLSFAELRELESGGKTTTPANKSIHLLAKIFNPIPFLIMRKIITGVKDVVFHSSLKFSLGLTLFPIWWCFSFFTINWLLGIIPATIVVLLMSLSLPISYRWLK